MPVLSLYRAPICSTRPAHKLIFMSPLLQWSLNIFSTDMNTWFFLYIIHDIELCLVEYCCHLCCVLLDIFVKLLQLTWCLWAYITWCQKWPQRMASYQLQPPAPFTFKSPEEWPRWKHHFEQFRQAQASVQMMKWSKWVPCYMLWERMPRIHYYQRIHQRKSEEVMSK